MNYYTNENDLNKYNSYIPNRDNNKNNISVLEMFVTSIIRIKQLAKLSVENSSRFVLYVIFMALLVSIMSFAVPTASRIYSFGGFSKLFTEGIPKIEVKDDIFTKFTILITKFLPLSPNIILLDSPTKEILSFS